MIRLIRNWSGNASTGWYIKTFSYQGGQGTEGQRSFSIVAEKGQKNYEKAGIPNNSVYIGTCTQP